MQLRTAGTAAGSTLADIHLLTTTCSVSINSLEIGQSFYSLCMFITQYVIWVPVCQYSKPTNNLQHHILCAPLRIKGMGRWLGVGPFVSFLSLRTVSVSLTKQGKVNLTLPGLPCDMKA